VYFVNKLGEIQLDDAPHGGLTALHQVEGLAEIAPTMLASEEQQALQYKSGAGEVFLNSRYIEELDWYLMVEQRERHVLAPITKTLLFNLAISLAIATVILALAHRVLFSYQKDLENSAHLDKLTGAYNRHAFEGLTLDAIEHSERVGSAVSMMFIDIDHFKMINDRHGHLAGDQAIEHVVAMIKTNLRASDSVCRWGGEEFCVLLRGCTQAEGAEVAQAVRRAIEQSVFWFGQTEITMTASIGVAQKTPTEKLSACFQRMDDALYEAKNGGRNRVCVASVRLPSSDESSACVHVTV
jgi:diguanylate cyclase (GGDEF)-like protein